MWRQKELPAAVLVDTRQVCGTREFVEQARRREIPVVSIHDLGLSPIPSDVVIDGSIAPDCSGFSPTAHFYTGTAYLVLDRSYAALPADRKEARETIQCVVVNLGGGDSRRYFDRILRGLQLWGRNLEVIGAPGFSCWGQDEFASRDWLPVHFRWIRGDEHLEQVVFGADLAVTAGGLSLYEALGAGTPALALSYDELQQTTVSSVARVNACVDLGRGDVLRPAQLPRALTLLEQDISGRQALSTRGRRIVDGRGLERVCQIVRDVILSSAIGNVEAGNDSGARV
jgi:spore coat polysaccharide biosynthesis predicted glycosyltransferase SpsG